MGIMGPESRALLTEILNHDMSTESFPFAAFQALELGCELYVSTDQASHLECG